MQMLLRCLVTLMLSISLGACAHSTPRPVEVNLAYINDLHGYLEPNTALYGQGAQGLAGGVANLGAVIDALRSEDPQTLLVGGGDLIGASPAISALWADEPTLEAMNRLGLQLSAVGNHELDNGKGELNRLIKGGCASNRPTQACQFESPWKGTRFPYLAANLLDADSGKPLFPAYRILEAHGQKIAFVGAVLHGLDQVVTPSGIAGLKVEDEANAINAQIPALRAQGVNTIVAVVHQGGSIADEGDGASAGCTRLQGPIVELVKRLNPAIVAVASAHTHKAYTCRVGKVLVFQAGSYGQWVTRVRFEIDPSSGNTIGVEAINLPVVPGRYPPDPALAELVAQVASRSQAILEQPVARLGVPRVERQRDRAGESPLGDLVADSQLAAVRHLGAEIALMNPGGIRNDLALAPGQTQLSFGELASALPFPNTLVLVSLSGAQLRQLLESQCRDDGSETLLQVSAGLSYQWDGSRPPGERIVPGSLRLDGEPIEDSRRYRLVVNSFLAEGGDGMALLKQGSERVDTSIPSLEALRQYLKAQEASGAPVGSSESAGRIQRKDRARRAKALRRRRLAAGPRPASGGRSPRSGPSAGREWPNRQRSSAAIPALDAQPG